MSERKATIMQSTVSKGAAELRFRGAWLPAVGFEPGLTVKVSSPRAGVLGIAVDGQIDSQESETA